MPRATERALDGVGGRLVVAARRGDVEANLRRRAPAKLLARALRHVSDISAAREHHLPEALTLEWRVAYEHDPDKVRLSGARGKGGGESAGAA